MRTRARHLGICLTAAIGLVLSALPAHARAGVGRGDNDPQTCASDERLTPEGIAVIVPLFNKEAWSRMPQGMANPYVRGVMIQVNWSQLEPEEGKYDWSQLDQIFDAAEKSRQWVHLSVFPGYFTPAWALAGVQTDNFQVQYGPSHGQTMALPMPWDEVYLGRWFKFTEQLADRYGKSKAFRIIGAAGPTSVSDEMTLPPFKGAKRLIADGYTPAKYLAAWNRALKTYARQFPNQCVSVSAPNMPILANDKHDPAAHMRWSGQVVEMAHDILGSRLAIQGNNLHAGRAATETRDDTDFITSYSGKIITGFMMRGASQGAVPSAVMGAAGNPPLALQRSIDKGMAPNAAGQRVDYLEIYLGDILPDDMQPVLKKTAARFRNSTP